MFRFQFEWRDLKVYPGGCTGTYIKQCQMGTPGKADRISGFSNRGKLSEKNLAPNGSGGSSLTEISLAT